MNKDLLIAPMLPNTTRLDSYMTVLLDENVISHNDLHIVDLSRPHFPRPRIQVYQQKSKTVKKGKVTFQEYNKIHYNYLDAIKDFLRLRGNLE